MSTGGKFDGQLLTTFRLSEFIDVVSNGAFACIVANTGFEMTAADVLGLKLGPIIIRSKSSTVTTSPAEVNLPSLAVTASLFIGDRRAGMSF